MPGYLDKYGIEEARRNRFIARSIIGGVSVLILGTLGWYLLENHHQEGVVKAFIRELKASNPDGAYRVWGCTFTKPCPGYSYENFMEDWGGLSKDPAKQALPDPVVFGITDSESCNNGVLLTVQVTSAREEKLWVDKSG